MVDKNALGSRIREIRAATGMSQTAFAEKLGLSQNMISGYERGENEPGLSTLETIASMLPPSDPRNLSWLVTGQKRSDSPAPPIVRETDDPMKDFAILPLHDVFAALGDGTVVDEEHVVGWRAFEKDWLKNEKLDPRRLSLIRVRGDSMEPSIIDGDTILVNHSVTTIVDGSIYVLQMSGVLSAKRLQRLYNGDILIKSDNPRYDPQTVPRDSADEMLRVIGEVVWLGRSIKRR